MAKRSQRERQVIARVDMLGCNGQHIAVAANRVVDCAFEVQRNSPVVAVGDAVAGRRGNSRRDHIPSQAALLVFLAAAAGTGIVAADLGHRRSTGRVIRVSIVCSKRFTR